MATSDRPIQYEPHPVSPERKKELIDKGFRILDIKFAPKDAPPAGMVPTGVVLTDGDAAADLSGGPRPDNPGRSSWAEPSPAPASAKPAATVEELSAADMRAELTARGIEFKPHAPKAALAELLKAAE